MDAFSILNRKSMLPFRSARIASWRTIFFVNFDHLLHVHGRRNLAVHGGRNLGVHGEFMSRHRQYFLSNAFFWSPSCWSPTVCGFRCPSAGPYLLMVVRENSLWYATSRVTKACKDGLETSLRPKSREVLISHIFMIVLAMEPTHLVARRIHRPRDSQTDWALDGMLCHWVRASWLSCFVYVPLIDGNESYPSFRKF